MNITKIHKETHDLQEGLVWHVYLNSTAVILHAGSQHQKKPHVSIWYSFDPAFGSLTHYVFTAVETGKGAVLEGFTYLNTVMMLDGIYIVHIYYKEVLSGV